MTADATEALYETFARYSPPRALEGCPCCVDPAESDALARADLRSLDVDDLDHYALKAISTWGDVVHFKHFLPRLFELLWRDPDAFMGNESLLGKLAEAAWTTWPQPETRAVASYLEQLWHAVLSRMPEDETDGRADTVLCGEALAGVALEPRLDVWLAMDGDAPRIHLANFVNGNTPTLRKKHKLANPHWAFVPAGASTVAAWLRSDRVLAWLGGTRGDAFGDVTYALLELQALRDAGEAR